MGLRVRFFLEVDLVNFLDEHSWLKMDETVRFRDLSQKTPIGKRWIFICTFFFFRSYSYILLMGSWCFILIDTTPFKVPVQRVLKASNGLFCLGGVTFFSEPGPFGSVVNFFLEKNKGDLLDKPQSLKLFGIFGDDVSTSWRRKSLIKTEILLSRWVQNPKDPWDW